MDNNFETKQAWDKVNKLDNSYDKSIVKCPDCGSLEFNHNPADNSKYVCKECGCFFD